MTGTLVLSGTNPLQVTTTSPGSGKVLVSDASGNVSWGTASSSGVSAPLALSSGQASSSILSVTNTTATPSIAALLVTSQAAGDRNIGVAVAGDSQRRLTIDSNGKFQWGPGNAGQDVNWYRLAAGVVGTDNTVQSATLQGSASASGTLTLSSTSNATKGKVLIGTSGYDEVNNRLGIAKNNPSVPLDVVGNAAISGTLSVSGSCLYGVATYTANHTAGTSDNVMLVSAASSSVTITLPTAVGITGTVYTIKRTDSTYTNTVTVATTSSQTIDGATTYTQLWVQYAFVQVASDGANWQIVDASSIPEAWIAIPYAAQWSDSGNPNQVGQYRRNVDGSVQFRGRAVFTSNGTTGLNSGAGTNLCTLGSNYQPATNHNQGWPVPCYGSPTISANRVPSLIIGQNGAGIITIFNVSSVTTNGTTVSVDLNGMYWL